MDKDKLIEFAKEQCEIFLEDSEMGKYLRETLKMLQAEQKPKIGHYEKHIDHTDCIWYGSDCGCPVTCSQYRDGWNDAMEYIFNDGKGYQPYRREK